MERHRERLITRMQTKGIAPQFAERVFEQIRGFGEYGFPESHAASFALIAYASCYLKRYHPAAFTAALIDAQPMGFYAPHTLVDDARRHGVTVAPVCINRSAARTTTEARDGAPQPITVDPFIVVPTEAERTAAGSERARAAAVRLEGLSVTGA